MHRFLSRRSLLGLAAWMLGTGRSRRAAAQAGDALETFEIEELARRREASGRPYLPFLEKDTLRCGLYVLPAGGEDKQSPHRTDEVYYVIRGRANIFVEGETRPVKPGSVIYVKREAEHRFVEIEEDLELLVFFD